MGDLVGNFRWHDLYSPLPIIQLDTHHWWLGALSDQRTCPASALDQLDAKYFPTPRGMAAHMVAQRAHREREEEKKGGSLIRHTKALTWRSPHLSSHCIVNSARTIY